MIDKKLNALFEIGSEFCHFSCGRGGIHPPGISHTLRKLSSLNNLGSLCGTNNFFPTTSPPINATMLHHCAEGEGFEPTEP